MTKDEVMDVFQGLQDELPVSIGVELGRFDQLGALIPTPTTNVHVNDVKLNFKANSRQVQLDRVLNELRDGLGRFLSTYDQYSGDVSFVVRLRNEDR